MTLVALTMEDGATWWFNPSSVSLVHANIHGTVVNLHGVERGYSVEGSVGEVVTALHRAERMS